MRPVTRLLPKEFLPVGGRPLIDFSLEACRRAGVKRIVFIVRPGKRRFQRLLEDWLRITGDDFEVAYVRQPQARGVGDAILRGEKRAGGRPFYLLMPDNAHFTREDILGRLARAYLREGKSLFAVHEVAVQKRAAFSHSGALDLSPPRGGVHPVLRVGTKRKGAFRPAGRRVHRSCGRSLITPEIFDALRATRPKQGEHDDAQAYDLLARRGRLAGVKIRSEIYDCGNWNGFTIANQAYFARRIGQHESL